MVPVSPCRLSPLACPLSKPIRGCGEALLALVAMAVLTGLLGLLGPVRRAGIGLANLLLGTTVPAPAGRPDAGSRLRSGLWLALHTLLSGVLLSALAFLGLGLLVPAVWLAGGQDRISLFWDDVPLGGWTVPFGLVLLFGTLVLLAGATRAFRAGAEALLGPSDTERAALAERRAAVLAQRNRLARELHDSIGHTLTTSTIQAAAAAELVEADPAQVRRALGTIEEASRSALEDLDHVLGLLREEPAAKEPTRTLAEVDVLAVRAREAGLDVRLTVSGPVAALPAAVSREGYRIVQEGLTNALRPRRPGRGRGPRRSRAGAARDRRRQRAARRRAAAGAARAGRARRARRSPARRSSTRARTGPRWRLSATIPLRAGA